MPTPKYPKDKTKVVADFSIKQKDACDMEMLYEAMHEWMINHGFASRDDQEFGETLFLQRVNDQGAREIWFWWRLEKVPEDVADKKAPRYKYQVRINTHTLGLKKTEIVKDGKKIKLDKGEIEIIIKAYLIKDPEDAWKKSWLPEIFKNWLWDRGMSDEHDKQEDLLYAEVYAFGEMIKRYFKMHALTSTPEGQFYPQSGVFE